MLLILKALWFITVEAVRTMIPWFSVWLCKETLKTFLALVQHDVDISNSWKKACIVGPQGDATCSRKHACECSSCGWMVRFDQWCLHCGSAETSSLGFLNYKQKQMWQLIWRLLLQNIQVQSKLHIAALVTVTAFSFLSFETQDYSQMYLSQWFSLRIDHLGCLLLLFVSGVSVSGTSRLENHKCLRTSCRAHAYSQSKANIWINFKTPQLQIVHVSMYFRCTWWLLWLFDPPAQFLIRDIGSRDAHQSICSCSGAEFCWRVAWPYHWLQHQEMGSILCIDVEYNRTWTEVAF